MTHPRADEEVDAAAGAPDALRAVRGESVASAIGSFMAGIEQQVFQRRPAGVELVREAQPVRGVSGDGLEVTITLPDREPPAR